MKHAVVTPVTLKADTNYYVVNQAGYYVGAVFKEGTLGPLSLFSASRKSSSLHYVRTLTPDECARLAAQPVMTWLQLVHGGSQSIALLRCRYDPYHTTTTPISTRSHKPHVGV